MPLLLIFLMISSCLPLPWPVPPFQASPTTSFVLICLAMLTSILWTASTIRKLVSRLKHAPTELHTVARAYHRFNRRSPWVTLALWILGISVGGWAYTVREQAVGTWAGPKATLLPAAELLIPLPYFITLFVNWISRYHLERLLHELRSQAASQPEPFWSLGGFLLFQSRNLAMFLALPLAVTVTHQTLNRAAPQFSQSDLAAALSLAGSVALLMFFPWFVPRILGLKPLNKEPFRTVIEQSCRRLRLRFAEIYFWPTRGQMVNALVLGIVPWFRYVIFTDRLLQELEPAEQLAVFGHEAGHVRHHHLSYYLLFLVLSGSVFSLYVAQWIKAMPLPSSLAPYSELFLLPLFIAYLYLVFGWLSRRCERQADVFGCRVGSCMNPRCGLGEDHNINHLGDRSALCPAGVNAMIQALERVNQLVGQARVPHNSSPLSRPSRRERFVGLIQAWQHGSMESRIAFLQKLREQPVLAEQADRQAFQARLMLAVGLTIALLSSAWF